VLFIFIWPYSTIIKCYWFSCDPITAYWGIFDSHGTSFHHINMLLILTVPHSSEWGHMRINNILVCWNEVTWESITHQYVGMRSPENQQYLSMLEWGHLRINNTSVCWNEVPVLLILRWPHSSILMCYWFSCDLIPAYWSIIDSQVTSF
jgi:hypothetical protein